MLGGDEILRYFSDHGADGVLKLLSTWSDPIIGTLSPFAGTWQLKLQTVKCLLLRCLRGCSVLLCMLLISWPEMNHVNSRVEALPASNSVVASL